MKLFRDSGWRRFFVRWTGVVVLIFLAFVFGSQLRLSSLPQVESVKACNWICKCGVCGCDDNASGFAAACAQNGGGSSSQTSSSNKASSSNSSGSQKCDGWAENGSTHRNSGNGCNYTCRNGSWSGPNQCDGQGNGQFQGDAAKTTEERARQEEAVRERQREAETRVREQGAEVTAQVAAQTADQRAREAARQQAMVEAQRQAAVAEAEAAGNQAAIEEANRRAQEASQQVSQAQGTDRGSEFVGSNDPQAREIAAVGYDPNSALAVGMPQMSSLSPESQIAMANAQVNIANLNSACDVNTGTPNSVAAGGACCRGGVVECGAGTNGTCMAELDRQGVVGYCGAAGQTSAYNLGELGERLFRLEGNECIPCSPTTGSSCVSLQVCLQQTPVVRGFSAQIQAQQRTLNQLYRQCYFDIDMIEGTLDPTCLSRIARLEQHIRELEAQGAAAVQQVRTQIQAERRVYGLVGTLAAMDIRCVGTPCTGAKEETQRQLNQAYDALLFYAPERVQETRQRASEHRQDTLNSFQERTQMVEQRRQALLAEAEACGKNNPDCVQNVQRKVDLQLRAFLQGSTFCSQYPNSPTCEQSVQDIQDRVNQIIEELPEEREEVSSCPAGTYETEAQCQQFGTICEVDAEGCWQAAIPQQNFTPVDPPSNATLPVTCSDGTPLGQVTSGGLFRCNEEGELVSNDSVEDFLAAPQRDAQITLDQFCGLSGRTYYAELEMCLESIDLTAQPAEISGSAVPSPAEQERQMGQALLRLENLNQSILNLEIRRNSALLDGRSQMAAVIQDEIDSLKRQRQELVVTTTQSLPLDTERRERFVTEVQGSLAQNQELVREQDLYTYSTAVLEETSKRNFLQSYQSLVSRLESSTQNPAGYNQLRRELDTAEGNLRAICPPQNQSVTCNQARRTIQSSQPIIESTQQEAARTGLQSFRAQLQQQLQKLENPISTEAVRMYPDIQSCERAGWSVCGATAIGGENYFHPRQDATFSDPNALRSLLTAITGRRGPQAGILSLSENQALQRVEHGLCHGANAAAGQRILLNGTCYQTDTRSYLQPITSENSASCRSDENAYRTVVGGSCLSTLVGEEQEAQDSAEESEPSSTVNFGEIVANITQVQEAFVQVEEINKQIEQLEVARLTELLEGRVQSAALLQQEIEELIAQRRSTLTQELSRNELSPLSRAQLAQRIQESIRNTDEYIQEQRFFFEGGAVSEAQYAQSVQQNLESLVATLPTQTNDVGAYNSTRSQLAELEREALSICPERNISEHCQNLRQQLEASRPTIQQTESETARNAFPRVLAAVQQWVPGSQQLTSEKLQRTYATAAECEGAGWTACEQRNQAESTVFQPSSESTFRDPNVIRRVFHTVASLVPTTSQTPEVVQEHNLAPTPAGKCHSGNSSSLTHVFVDGQCYQISSASFLVPLGGADADRCRDDENFVRTQVGWSCLATARSEEPASLAPSGCSPRGEFIEVDVFCNESGELVQADPVDLQSQVTDPQETQSRNIFAPRLQTTWCQLRGRVFIDGVCLEKNAQSSIPEGGTDWLNEDEPSSGVITPDLSASDAEIESRTQRVRTARAQQERAARQERARIRRNILLIAQLADRVVTTAPVVSNIVTGTLSALAENSSAPLSYDRIVIDELRPKDQNFTPPRLS